MERDPRHVVGEMDWLTHVPRLEFYMVLKGEQILQISNRPIKVPPLINFMLHDLAEEPWRLRVRHRIRSGEARGRPRLSITNGKRVNISFRLPLRSELYRSVDEALADLQQTNWEESVEMKYIAPNFRRPHEREELELLQLFNERRKRALGDYVPPIVPAKNILRLVDLIKPAEVQEVQEDVKTFLRTA